MAVRFAPVVIIRGYAGFVALAFVLIAAGAVVGLTPRWTLLALAPVPLALRVYRGLRAHYDDPYGLVPALGANIALHALTGLLLIGGYVIEVTT